MTYPSHADGLTTSIVQARSTIEYAHRYAYIVGAVASIVTALTITVHAPDLAEHGAGLLSYSVRPLIYAILFAELWFRPFKRRMETMLHDQLAASQAIRT